jgi:hypothetical protein
MQRLLSYSTKNMIYSLLAVFALAVGLWALMPGEHGVNRQSVETGSVAAYAAEQVDWEVYVPEGLGEDWTVTTVRFDPIAGVDTWRVGLRSPSDGFVALSQAAGVDEAWRDAVLGDTGRLGEQPLDGPGGSRPWQHWAGGGLTALLLSPDGADGATTVVHGTADEAELVEVVEHLSPVSG